MSKSVCVEANYRGIFESQSEKLRNFMYYRCGDLDKAEDLMQEAFVRLWENCKKVVIAQARSYLFTTAHRLFLNQVEHEKVVLAFEKQPHPGADIHDPEFQLRSKEFKTRLEKAISDLPSGQREVFLMHRIDKVPFEEIARMQGVSLGAVHKKIYKALDRLKKSVNELRDRKF